MGALVRMTSAQHDAAALGRHALLARRNDHHLPVRIAARDSQHLGAFEGEPLGPDEGRPELCDHVPAAASCTLRMPMSL
jgi:hypothetical protein